MQFKNGYSRVRLYQLNGLIPNVGEEYYFHNISNISFIKNSYPFALKILDDLGNNYYRVKWYLNDSNYVIVKINWKWFTYSELSQKRQDYNIKKFLLNSFYLESQIEYALVFYKEIKKTHFPKWW
jgi:hypothetical protein